MSMLKKYWKWIGGLFIGSAYASTFLIGGAPPDVKLDSVKSNILNVRLFERTELFNCQGAPISCERRQIPMVEYQYYSDLVVPEADEVGRTETTVTVRRNGKDITSFSAKPHSRIINGQWRKLEYEKATRSDYEATLPIVYEFINRAFATVTTFNASRRRRRSGRYDLQFFRPCITYFLQCDCGIRRHGRAYWVSSWRRFYI